MQFPEHVVKYGPWSISKAGVIEKCSLQFDFKYTKKIKELTQFQASRVGVAVHKALELALGGTPLKMAFLHAKDQSELTTDEEEQLETFWDQVDRFVKTQVAFRKKHGVIPQNVFLEQQWGMKTDFTGSDFFGKQVFFRGVVDYAVLTPKMDLIIIDHKSGKEKDLSEYDAQFKSYALMALARIPNLRGVQTAINFVMPDKMAWNKYVKAEVIRDEYRPWMVEYLTKSCEGLLSEPVAKKGWYCDWCGYKPICPAFGNARAPEQTK